MAVHAALAVLLARLGDTDDVSVGTPIAGRGDAALDDMVGMFVNTLVLRTPVEPADTFTDLLSTVRDTDLSASTTPICRSSDWSMRSRPNARRRIRRCSRWCSSSATTSGRGWSCPG